MAPRRTPYEHDSISPNASANEIEIETDNQGLEVRLDDDPVVSVEPAAVTPSEPVTTPVDPEPEPQRPSADDEAFLRLKAQLDREKMAREAAQERTRQLENEHLSTRERLRQEQERGLAIQRERMHAQELAIDNAISYAETQASQAQREISRALSEGDYEASTAAYRLLAKAEADLTKLRDGKSDIEAQKSAPVQQQRDEPQLQQQPTTLYDRVESYITQPGHSPRVQQYLRSHYNDLFSDFDDGANRISRLLGGHYITKADGVVEGSDAYFDALDRHMGYKDAAPKHAPMAAVDAPPLRKPIKQVPPAAPVSRSTQAQDGTTGTSVTLTPAQVQFCKESNISPKEYAKMLLRAKAGGKDPSYSGPRFTGDL